MSCSTDRDVKVGEENWGPWCEHVLMLFLFLSGATTPAVSNCCIVAVVVLTRAFLELYPFCILKCSNNQSGYVLTALGYSHPDAGSYKDTVYYSFSMEASNMKLQICSVFVYLFSTVFCLSVILFLFLFLYSNCILCTCVKALQPFRNSRHCMWQTRPLSDFQQVLPNSNALCYIIFCHSV